MEFFRHLGHGFEDGLSGSISSWVMGQTVFFGWLKAYHCSVLDAKQPSI